MADATRPGGETSLPTTGGEPGTLSRLLLEIARAPEEAVSTSWRDSLRAGEAVGRYQVREEIGRGGFGAVYEAFDPELARAVALKTLRPGRPRRELTEDWVKREAEAIARLDHPGIVTIFDMGTCPAGPYLVMERLVGETLAQRLERGPLPPEEALRVAEDMARALAHAHHRGVLHRDLKPANVFLTLDGRVKLLDFGLAHLLGQEGGSGGGTPAYMAPEQARGDPVDERADVYAAGMVLGEMLSGRRLTSPATPEEPPGSPPGDRETGPNRLAGHGARAPTGERSEPPNEAAGPTLALWREPVTPAALPPRRSGVSPGRRLPGIPRPLSRTLTAALAPDPSARPRDGSAWLATLQGARRSFERPRAARRIALLGSAFLLLGLAVAGIATWQVWERQIPGGRPTVAVADFVNETGERELDSISTLLITALEQSAQLRVLTRGRMVDVLRQLGKGEVARIDEPLAREVGREAGARALLLASIRRLGDAYVVEMRALDPLHDEYLFTVSDRASGKGAVFDLVDRLGAATRKRLATRADPAPPPTQVASITTTNLKAWELVSRSRQALDRADPLEAKRLALEALAEDPQSVLAHYQVALAAWRAGNDTPEGDEEIRTHLEAASRLSDRLPEKERLSLLAMRASADGRLDEALQIQDRVAEAYPLDKEAQWGAGAIRLDMGRAAEAAPWFARALQLDNEYVAARQALAHATSDAPEELADWMLAQAALFKSPSVLRRLACGLLAVDREAEAVDVLRRAARPGDPPWPDIMYPVFLADRGRGDEALSLLRAALAGHDQPAEAEPGWVNLYRWGVVYVLDAQGRFTESEMAADRLALSPQARLEIGQGWRLERLRGDDALREGFRALRDRGVPPFDLAHAAVIYGQMDSVRRYSAMALAERSLEKQGGLERRHVVAFAAWGEGDLEGASRQLRELSRSPNFNVRYTDFFWLGLIELQRGSCPAAIEYWERARTVRWPPWVGTPAMPPWVGARAGLHPRLLHHLASCYERLGDLAKARERNDEMLRLWARADPDLPLLLEAKALRARLGAR